MRILSSRLGTCSFEHPVRVVFGHGGAKIFLWAYAARLLMLALHSGIPDTTQSSPILFNLYLTFIGAGVKIKVNLVTMFARLRRANVSF